MNALGPRILSKLRRDSFDGIYYEGMYSHGYFWTATFAVQLVLTLADKEKLVILSLSRGGVNLDQEAGTI